MIGEPQKAYKFMDFCITKKEPLKIKNPISLLPLLFTPAELIGIGRNLGVELIGQALNHVADAHFSRHCQNILESGSGNAHPESNKMEPEHSGLKRYEMHAFLPWTKTSFTQARK